MAQVGQLNAKESISDASEATRIIDGCRSGIVLFCPDHYSVIANSAARSLLWGQGNLAQGRMTLMQFCHRVRSLVIQELCDEVSGFLFESMQVDRHIVWPLRDGRILEVFLTQNDVKKTGYSRIIELHLLQTSQYPSQIKNEDEAMLKTIAECLPQLIFICEKDGNNTYFNQRWVDYTGLSRADSRGQGWTRAFHEEDRQAGSHTTVDHSGYETECRIRGCDGFYRWFLIRAYPLFGENREVTKWLGTCTDIHEMKVIQQELQDTQDELERRVDERTKELQVAMCAAEQASQAKGQFLSRTSHELRTPLNAVLGFSQLLQQSDLLPDDRESVDMIVSSGRYLLTLIDELLDLASVESGQHRFTLEPVSVAPVLAECFDLVRNLARQRDIELSLVVPEGQEVFVKGDARRLTQIVLNLLSNGIKYNRHGGLLEVELTEAGGHVAIAVRDRGDGLSENQMERLFDPFERLDAANTDIQGSGLGLTVAQSLARAMNGDLTVISTVGEGSVFTLTLPSLAEEGELDLIEPVGSVLYIDDEPVNIQAAQDAFEKLPHLRLDVATDTMDGLQRIAEERPNLVLLNVDLQDLALDEVMTALQSAESTRHIPLIFLTAGSETNLPANGAECVLQVPLGEDQVLQAVNRALCARLEI